MNVSICCFLLSQVICSVLQIINQIIKDNTDFQENACHVGLVSTNAFNLYWYSVSASLVGSDKVA